jgi:hypothetical protein
VIEESAEATYMKHGKIPGTFEQDAKESHNVDKLEEEKAEMPQEVSNMERNANSLGIKVYGGRTYE